MGGEKVGSTVVEQTVVQGGTKHHEALLLVVGDGARRDVGVCLLRGGEGGGRGGGDDDDPRAGVPARQLLQDGQAAGEGGRGHQVRHQCSQLGWGLFYSYLGHFGY